MPRKPVALLLTLLLTMLCALPVQAEAPAIPQEVNPAAQPDNYEPDLLNEQIAATDPSPEILHWYPHPR